MTLRKQAVVGVRWTSVATIIIAIFQFAQIAVLARYLSPKEFGVMSIMMVVIGFARSFEDMGISNAIIHHQKVSHEQLSSLYWLNILSGLVLAIIILMLSPLVAWFYDTPEISRLMMILSSVFILVAIGNQYRILYEKNLEFRIPALAQIMAAFVSFIVAGFFAVRGYGVEALVFGLIAGTSVSSAIFLWFGLRYLHRPALIYRHNDIRAFYGFGLYQMGERSVNYLSANIDKLLIGKFAGMDALGVYTIAWQLAVFPVQKINPIVNKVAFPVFSKLQNDRYQLARYYTINIRLLALVIVPLLVFLAVFSTPVVQVAFGSGWDQVTSLLPFLAVVGLLKCIGNPGGAVMLALGRADVGFWWNLAWGTVVTLGLYFGLIVSPTAFAAVCVLLGLSICIGWIWHLLIIRIGLIDYWPIVIHCIRVICVTLGIAILVRMGLSSLSIDNTIVRITYATLVCALAYAVYLLAFEKTLIQKLRSV